MASTFSHSLAHASGGRRYCFVIMSYHDREAFFRDVKRIVTEETGFECLRADDILAPAEAIRDKIHAAIESAVFVLADITDPRPNIYYEIGYAIARGKPVLLLIRKGVTPQTDLQGIELIEYVDTRDGWRDLEWHLRQHLGVHRDSNVSLLRAMIIPPSPEPSYIVLNPKHPNHDSPRHPRESRTYGDYLGLMGILNAFASVFGEHHAPEIVSASHAEPKITDWDANLFLIGSPKVNPFTTKFLSDMQDGRGPNWEFPRPEGAKTEDDYEVRLTGWLSSRNFSTPVGNQRGTWEREDHGLIVRGPHPKHPKHPGRTVTIMAGPHSLGTGAACLAATKPQLVRKVADKLADKSDLSSHDRYFWVLVKATASHDYHVDDSSVEVVEASVYG